MSYYFESLKLIYVLQSLYLYEKVVIVLIPAYKVYLRTSSMYNYKFLCSNFLSHIVRCNCYVGLKLNIWYRCCVIFINGNFYTSIIVLTAGNYRCILITSVQCSDPSCLSQLLLVSYRINLSWKYYPGFTIINYDIGYLIS